MDYEARLVVLDLFPLEYRRLRGDLILTYALFEQGLANRFFTVDPANTRRGHGERQLLKDRNKTDPGNLGESPDPVYQSVRKYSARIFMPEVWLIRWTMKFAVFGKVSLRMGCPERVVNNGEVMDASFSELVLFETGSCSRFMPAYHLATNVKILPSVRLRLHFRVNPTYFRAFLIKFRDFYMRFPQRHNARIHSIGVLTPMSFRTKLASRHIVRQLFVHRNGLIRLPFSSMDRPVFISRLQNIHVFALLLMLTAYIPTDIPGPAAAQVYLQILSSVSCLSSASSQLKLTLPKAFVRSFLFQEPRSNRRRGIEIQQQVMYSLELDEDQYGANLDSDVVQDSASENSGNIESRIEPQSRSAAVCSDCNVLATSIDLVVKCSRYSVKAGSDIRA
ncbi:hypothetical protein CLF_107228 [Clonorchis sinensis]|uniref:Uncharacterized protein n=1 Tax=Clonorchis sinensis TaxID=79923 RepID=G7YGD5_CLOSI|nr:hypothetical protein CLF_107228 [Clonorchis sinensis]